MQLSTYILNHNLSRYDGAIQINAEGLLAVIEKKAQGEEVVAEDFVVVQVTHSICISIYPNLHHTLTLLVVVVVQREVQKQKQLQRAQKDVQRVLQNASESENRLGVALKVSAAAALGSITLPYTNIYASILLTD